MEKVAVKNTTTFFKKTLRLFLNIKVFLENIKVFFAAWEVCQNETGLSHRQL